MEFKYDIEFTDNTPAVLDALKDWVLKVLEKWGEKITDYAKLLAPTDTSRLKNSITFDVDAESQTVTVGTNVQSDTAKWPNGAEYDPAPYPVFVELGTGVYAEKGDGRKEPWYWYDMKTKQWHYTIGQKPKPFLRPAVKDHLDEYRQIAIDEANN